MRNVKVFDKFPDFPKANCVVISPNGKLSIFYFQIEVSVNPVLLFCVLFQSRLYVFYVSLIFNVLFLPVPLVAFMMDLQFTLLRSMISKMVEKHELGESAKRW